MHYHINTNTHWYNVNEAGRVIACSNGFKSENYDGHQWDIVGAVSYSNFGYINNRLSLPELHALAREDRRNLKYKNGNGKYHIVDIDHGTRRIHGQTIQDITKQE